MSATQEHDDRQLVERFLRSGDETAFRILFRRHTPALLQLAGRFLGRSDAGVEDAIQEVWLRAASALPGFAWHSTLRTWLSGIAVRCCYERIRARGGRFIVPAGDELTAGRSPAPVEIIDLERALRGLPDGYRAVLLLHDLEGWTHRDIAAQLEIQIGTSKSQLTRARRALRAYWLPAAAREEQKDG
jgi:RNA polymerase sigma factor (sigma-70 family)